MNGPDVAGVLSKLFADYRAEWPEELFGSLFVRPSYFNKLEAVRPSFLVGGRGTGKTTALRSLRFDATARRLRCTAQELPYFGVYVRANKNRVRAFEGSEINPGQWSRAFAHYFNLLVLAELCLLAEWMVEGGEPTAPLDLSPVAESLGMTTVPASVGELRKAVGRSIRELELFVNNPHRGAAPLFSLAEVPIRAFAEAFSVHAGSDKPIFCCIDEYENLLDYQQGILNAYIKHSAPPLSYKIGVRRYGHRNKSTIDAQDLLTNPDDYTEIDIAKEEDFESFGRDVVAVRLERASEKGTPLVKTLDDFLEPLTMREEAEQLGSRRIVDAALAELRSKAPQSVADWFAAQPPGESYFAAYWAERTGDDLERVVCDWRDDPKDWAERLNNHRYASLFWISRGRRGAGIKKYYCGADTFLALSGGNIRYFLELLDESIRISLEQDQHATPPLTAKAQTLAARFVGQRRLEQLEGLSDHGIQLKRLVLTIGKVFFEFARSPIGRQPETNMFVLSGEGPARGQALRLLHEGVSHLAFEVQPRTKATSPTEMRDDEYRLHPIYCAFFEFSYRRKRHVAFDAKALMKIAEAPRQAISELLKGKTQTPPEELPEQLAIFEAFFGGDHAAPSTKS